MDNSSSRQKGESEEKSKALKPSTKSNSTESKRIKRGLENPDVRQGGFCAQMFLFQMLNRVESHGGILLKLKQASPHDRSF